MSVARLIFGRIIRFGEITLSVGGTDVDNLGLIGLVGLNSLGAKIRYQESKYEVLRKNHGTVHSLILFPFGLF